MRLLILIALCALTLQFLSGIIRSPSALSSRIQLPPVPIAESMQTLALGEPIWLSRALSVWMQFNDHHAGAGLAWNALDYRALSAWLDLQLQLDPHNPFPPLAAIHLYGGVEDPFRVRLMVDYTVSLFRKDPARHWRWMADAAILAKHRLQDIALAEQIASELDQGAKGVSIPSWARQMHIFLKADLGERELAAAILEALIKSGDVSSKEELTFLQRRLREMSVGVENLSER